jgi:hypothetical protein
MAHGRVTEIEADRLIVQAMRISVGVTDRENAAREPLAFND